MMTIGQQGTVTPSISNPDEFFDQPWVELTTIDEVEAWVDQLNRDLQHITHTNSTGCGVRFSFTHGGEIYMHTTEGAILLDVTPEAEWVVPVITTTTAIEDPNTQIWVLPDDVLMQLVLGLSSLIATTRIVVSHNYKTKR